MAEAVQFLGGVTGWDERGRLRNTAEQLNRSGNQVKGWRRHTSGTSTAMLTAHHPMSLSHAQ